MKYVVLITAFFFEIAVIRDIIAGLHGRESEFSVRENVRASIYIVIFVAAFFVWPQIQDVLRN